MKKIIHIVENLDKGAVENWLVLMFLQSREINRNIEWTFYCILGQPGRLDNQVLSAGGKIIYSPVTLSRKWDFLKHLRITLKHGQFDIIHSHHDFLSGYYLLASVGISFKKRILHVHNTDKSIPVGNLFLQKMLISPLRQLAYIFSDLIVGISVDSLNEFIQKKKPRGIETMVLYYGISLDIYRRKLNKSSKFNELGLSGNGIFLLFVGRMNRLKNPVFVVDILAKLLEARPDVNVLFVGKGDEEVIVQSRAKELGVENHIHLLGWRDDIADLMRISDVFIFPRREFPKEGLGLVVVEAQTAGLPMVLSYGIVNDAIIIPEITRFVKLESNPGHWAEVVLNLISDVNLPDAESCFQRIKSSPFECKGATQNLLKLYEC